MKTILKKFAATLAFFTIALSANAQKNYVLDVKTNFAVFGTSTMHDWEMKSGSKVGTANLTVADNKLTAITSINITLVSETLKSEKTKMDKIAYETLKTDKHKQILYALKHA